MIRALSDLDIHVQRKCSKQQEETVNSHVLWSTEEDSKSDTIFIGDTQHERPLPNRFRPGFRPCCVIREL